jgi:arabinoxylan arabinofuranohydrolase
VDEILPTRALVTPGYQYNSDPTCREINGRFYLFTTHDPFTVNFQKNNDFFRGMYDCHAYSTTDFDHWIDHGSLLNTHDSGWHQGSAVWDGDLGIPANGKFYAYIPFRMNPDSEDNYGHYQIGVFEADRIEGPYGDVHGSPLRSWDGQEIWGLSPTVVYADSGEPYLIWGGDAGVEAHHTVSLAKLKPSMTELAEPAHLLQVEEYNAAGGLEYFESPILFKRGELWYLTYVAIKDLEGKRNLNYTETDLPGCYIQYATSKSMFGPFHTGIRHFIHPTLYGDHNNQQGVCLYRGEWYVAYHIGSRSRHRQVCVTKIGFEADGSLVPIFPDQDPGAGTPGVSHLTLDAFANKREAQEFHARQDATDEDGILRDVHFKLKDCGYLRFNGIDFGNGAQGYRVEVSCENPGLNGGHLEFRLGNPQGQKIADARIEWTKGSRNYVTLTGPATPVPGVHDVFLLARGQGGDAEGHLFNLNWFTFTRGFFPERKAVYAVDCGGVGEDGLQPDQAAGPEGWGYVGNTVAARTDAVIYYNASLPNALKTGRMPTLQAPAFGYRFPVPGGSYGVQLLFAEIGDAAYGARTFDVEVNGRVVLENFEILTSASGPNRVAVREFPGIKPAGGGIEVRFLSKGGRALVNAIRVYADAS